MKRTELAINKVMARLKKLRDSRPNELDSQPAGFEGISYQLMLDAVQSVIEQVRGLSQSKWANEPEVGLIDIGLSKEVTEAAALVSQAQHNGTHWMLHSGFISKLGEIALRVSSLADRRAGIARNLGKELAKEATGAAARVLEAASIIEEAKKAGSDVLLVKKSVDEQVCDLRNLVEELRGYSEEISKLKLEIEASHTVSLERRAESERLSAETASFRAKSEERSAYFDEKLAQLEESLAESRKILDESVDNLRGAMRDVRRQGLAGAFNRRARNILAEKIAWLGVFLIAVAGLAILAVKLAVDVTDLTYEVLAVSLLRRLVFAAPMIWLGWYAARQVGRLNVIQEDYEYKAATALAFESYRNEIETSGDESLTLDLLRTTVRNFGDNPVRLWNDQDNEVLTPTEELVRRLDEDGALGLLNKLRALFGKN
jgi:hypothetical protein